MSSSIRARVVTSLLVLALLSSSASATWSIVMVDVATGEMAIGCATCLVNFDLEEFVPVVVPGHGVAAAQALVSGTGTRIQIRNELLAGTPPAQILANLAATDAFHEQRQYGFVDLQGRSLTFTGNQTFPFAGGVTGQSTGSKRRSRTGGQSQGRHKGRDCRTPG